MNKPTIPYGTISTILTGRSDVIRENRIPKKYIEAVKELNTFMEYWYNKHVNNIEPIKETTYTKDEILSKIREIL